MTIRSTRHRGWAAATACAGVLLLAGCGGSGTSATSARATTSAAASSAAASSTPATSAAAEPELTIADAWVKATVGTDTTMTAAFGVLTNATDQDLTIVSATNDVTDRTELHEMAMVDGAMVMRPVAGGIAIPANGSTTLEPGGPHVMIMDATEPIAPGDDVHVTLTLKDGTTVTMHATAKDFAGANESYDPSAFGAADMGTSAATDTGTSTAADHDDGGAEASHTHG